MIGQCERLPGCVTELRFGYRQNIPDDAFIDGDGVLIENNPGRFNGNDPFRFYQGVNRLQTIHALRIGGKKKALHIRAGLYEL